MGRLKGNEVLFTSVAFASANVAMPAASLYLESLSGSRYLQCKKRHTVQAHSGASRVEEEQYILICADEACSCSSMCVGWMW